MGTSLSGLTPATTFDGLLKTSDNDAITSSLKTIGSGDGTDSCLQLSDSALKVNSGAVTIVGVGNTGATSSLLIQNSSASDLLRVNDSGEIRMQTLDFLGNKITSLARISTSGLAINNAGTSPDANTQLHIKGSGATSATTSLLVQNSSGGSVFSIRDDGALLFHRVSNSAELLRIDDAGSAPRFVQGNNVGKSFTLGNDSILSAFTSIQFKTYDGSAYSEAMRITGNTDQFVGIGETIPTARLHVKGAGNTDATTSLLVQNSDGDTLLKVVDDGEVRIGETTGSLTAEGNNVFLRGTNIYFRERLGGYLGNFREEGFQIGNGSAAATAKLQVKGSGATSATTSLLVENSDGTEHLKITDDGVVNARQSVIVNHATNSSRSLKLSWGSIYATDNQSELSIGAVLTQASTAPRITLGGKTRASGADAVLVQALNGMYLSTTAYSEDPSAQLHVKAGTTQDSIAKFEDPRATTDYIEIKNDSTLTDYTGLYWGTRAKIRSKQTGGLFLDCTSGILFADGNTAKSKIDANGNMSVGVATIPASTRMTIKGQGATSATTALLVENSSGTDTLEVRDDGRVVAGTGATTNANGTFNVLHGTSNLTTRVFTVSRDSVLRGMDINSGGSTKISDSSGDQSFSHTATAVLEVSSTDKGFLPPRMTGTQRDAIESPASGLIIYNTTTNKAQCYNGTSWNDMF